MEQIRVLIAEDHAVVREGLKMLVNAQADMEVVGEASSGQEALEKTFDLNPDVVLMDVTMPKLNGAQAARRLKAERPDVRVLALSVHEDKAYLRELLAAGALGYVLKRSAAEELINAIRVVASRGVYLDPALADKVVGGFILGPAPERSPLENTLSQREGEVLRLIARGFSNKEIASRLVISIKTVETYKTRAMSKTGLQNRADIVRYAVEHGWLQGGAD